jgi:hypothetical protein
VDECSSIRAVSAAFDVPAARAKRATWSSALPRGSEANFSSSVGVCPSAGRGGGCVDEAHSKNSFWRSRGTFSGAMPENARSSQARKSSSSAPATTPRSTRVPDPGSRTTTVPVAASKVASARWSAAA